jgi:nitronate monooxygenase
MSLVPQVVDAVTVPVIAAGGIADSRGVAAALALGADGVQLGTAFLPFEESGASRLHRELIRDKRATPTALTKNFTGRLARGVRNRLMDALSGANVESLPYPLQRAIIRPLSAAADANGRADLAQLWAGQSANLAPGGDVSAFLSSLVAGVSTVLTSSRQAPSAHPARRAN